MRPKTLGLIAVGLAAAAAGAYACVDNGGTTDVTCPKYCADIQATCTGVDQQYADDPTCEAFCNAMDHGEAGIAAGDTIACRDISVSNAKDEIDPNAKHQDCVGGGPSTTCTQDQCATFCKLDLALCGTQRTGYADVGACETACATWGKSFDGQLLGSTGNTLQCRTYHLELSQTGNAADLETHCPHTGVVSARCFDSDAGTDAATDAAPE